MEIIRLDRDKLSNARAGITNTLTYRSTVQDDIDPVSGWESFSAGWERDHAETALFKTVDRWMSGDNTDQPDPDFNPYGYISKTWDENRKARMALAIDDGLFDDLQGPWAVEQQAAKIERDFDLEQKLAANPWSGFAGSLAANIFTLTNLIPIAGWSSKASLLANVGRTALTAGLSQVPGELILRSEHPMRSWSESIMNIGTAGVIGGGLGAFGHALNKGHALAHLEADALEGKPVSIRHSGEEKFDVVDDLSAAANPDIKRKFWLQDRPIDVIGGKIVGNLVKYANKVTPTGRLLNAMSPEVHKVALSLLDTGGVLFRTVKGYIAPGPSAEDIKRIMVNLTKDHVFAEASRTFIAMNKKLGEQGFKKIDLQTFQNVTRDKLIGAWNAGDAEKLVTDLGQTPAAILEAAAEQSAQVVRKVDKLVEEKLTKLGFLRDQSAVDSMTARVDQTKTKVEALYEKRKQIKEQFRADKEASPKEDVEGRKALKVKRDEAVAQINDEIKKLQTDVEPVKAELRNEMAKPEPLGDDYGMAQLWDRQSIIADREGFEQWLMEKMVSRPDDEWLAEKGLTQDKLEALRTSDPNEYRKVIRDWAGDQWYYEIDRLEKAVDSASEEVRQLELDLNELMRASGWTDSKLKQSSRSEIIAKRDAKGAQVRANRSKREQLDTERRTLRTALQAGIQRENDRLSMHIEQRPDVGAAELTASQKADARLASFYDRVGNGKRPYDQAVDEKLGRNAKQAREAAFDNPLEAPKAPEPELSVERAKLDGRLQELDREIAKIDRQVEADTAHLKAMNELLAKYENRTGVLKGRKAALESAVRAVADEKGIVEKDLRSLKAKLKATAKRGAIHDVVRDMTNRMIGDRSSPLTDIADDANILQESGRLKERRIRLSPEERREAIQKGWLEGDLARVLSAQYEQLSGHIAIREAFDIRRGGTFESWKDVMQNIDRDYAELIAKAPDAKSKAALVAQLEDVKKDITTARGRLLGMENVGLSPDSKMLWATRKARQANFIRFGSDFLVSSWTDPAIFSLRHRLIPTLAKHGGRALRAMFKGIPDDRISFMARASELAHGDMALAARIGDDDALLRGGIGVKGTTGQKITSAIDKGLGKTTDVVARYSGVPAWNTFWKSLAGYAMTEKLYKLARKGWDSLSEKEAADLASLGLDRTRLARLDRFMEKYGDVEKNGVVHANVDDWLKEANGWEAYRDYMMVIGRDQRRANLTIGIGDTPRLLDTWWGKFLFQFQTFSFVALNKYLTPLLQGFAMKGSRIESAANFMLLMSTTIPILAMKAAGRGDDPRDIFKDKRKLAIEMLDRSGLFSYASPYVDASLKLLFPDWVGASRYQRNQWWQSALGPSFGLAGDVSSVATTLRDGDVAKAAHKATVLLPFGQWMRRGYHLFADE